MGSCDREALPSDMIFEILSRSSWGTVQRCKKVSKSMKQMIYGNPTFLPLHCQRTNAVFGYFFQKEDFHRYGTSFVFISREGAAPVTANWPYENLKILASSDEGILFCLRKGTESSPYSAPYSVQYYASKPATNQWQELPNPTGPYATAAAAIVILKSNPLHYIILHLVGTECEIFDSETWAWESIECGISYSWCTVHPWDTSVTVGRSVNWLTFFDSVLTFDINERMFHYLALPETAPYCYWKQLVEYEGGLGFVGGDERCMELWVAEDGEWRKKMSTRGLNPVDFCSSDVVFARSEDESGFYNLRDGSFTGVEVPYAFRDPKQVFRFRSDFEIVNLGGAKMSHEAIDDPN